MTISQYVKTLPELSGTAPIVEVCSLGHPLGDCPARRAGCRNHYQMLNFMLPPWSVRSHVSRAMGDSPEVRQWLANLDAVLPGGHR